MAIMGTSWKYILEYWRFYTGEDDHGKCLANGHCGDLHYLDDQ